MSERVAANLRFGTDGIRGRAPEELSPAVARALGAALRGLAGPAPVAVGRDTRASGLALREGLLEGLGGEVVDLGVLPTGGFGALLAAGEAGYGVMITASHNPAHDNGLKVLRPGGGKASDAEERALEAGMAGPLAPAPPLALRHLDGAARVTRLLVERAPVRLDGLKIVLDAAHGAAWSCGPAVLRALGAEVVPLGCAPDGHNINAGLGATAPEALAQAVVEHGAQLGVALDGDADRCVLVDARGQVVDGDALLWLVARPPGLVGTVMCNAALERACVAAGLGFERVGVGDRLVAARLAELGWPVGGEPSGHVLFADGLPGGDGLYTALRVLAGGADLVGRLRGWRPDPQVQRGVSARVRVPLEALVQLAQAEAAAHAAGVSRTLVRWSGTEPKLRILVEAPDAALAQGWAERLVEVATAEICARALWPAG